MSRPIAVEHDPVTGSDVHTVQGLGPNPSPPPPTAPYAGTGTFAYTGSMTGGLSPFVTVNGVPVALVTSRSTLGPAETAPGGGHTGPLGRAFTPTGTTPLPTPQTLRITDSPLGTGTPAAGAGSALLTVAGAAVLLDGDPIDTCGGHGTVAARGQSFVSCGG